MGGSRSSPGVIEHGGPAGDVPTHGVPPPDPDSGAPVGPDAPILAVMATTRAMRRLAPDPVPAELIRRVIEAATWAPSGGNQQPVAYLVVTDREVLARLAPLWRRVIDDYGTLMASAGVEPPAGRSADLIRASIAYQADHFAETPALVLVCEDLRAYGAKRGTAGAIRVLLREVGVRRTVRLVRAFGRARRTEAGSIYPAVQNLLLAARAYGLGACLTSWHVFAEDEFKAVLGIPRDVRTWVAVPIGWPLGRFGPVNRRPVDDVIHWERW